jgi:hypothetical protein
MPGGINTNCMYSVFKNTSGVRKTFGFLPPHGRTLDPDEEMAIFGDAYSMITQGIERSDARRKIMAFEAAKDRGDIDIVQQPNPILSDMVTQEPVMLSVAGGVVSAGPPCWTESISFSSPWQDDTLIPSA